MSNNVHPFCVAEHTVGKGAVLLVGTWYQVPGTGDHVRRASNMVHSVENIGPTTLYCTEKNEEQPCVYRAT